VTPGKKITLLSPGGLAGSGSPHDKMTLADGYHGGTVSERGDALIE